MHKATQKGFTLVELLVATAILVVILVISIGVFGQFSDVWQRSVETNKAFQSGRLAFDLVTRNLGQATLNTYLDYVDSANRFSRDNGYTTPPVRYARNSDLRFFCAPAGSPDPDDGSVAVPGTPGTGTAVFFQAPLGFTGTNSGYTGLDSLLNVCGYYVEFGPDNSPPGFVTTPSEHRYRLMQMLVPAEGNKIFSKRDTLEWFKNSSYVQNNAYPIADNIVAFVLIPLDPSSSNPLSTTYAYDSRKDEKMLVSGKQPITANQLPPLMRLVMVAIDERSALRLQNGAAAPEAITDALAGKFEINSRLDLDIQELTAKLTAEHLGNQVFSTTVAIRESKWSKE